jgi:hypothetical protein
MAVAVGGETLAEQGEAHERAAATATAAAPRALPASAAVRFGAIAPLWRVASRRAFLVFAQPAALLSGRSFDSYPHKQRTNICLGDALMWPSSTG